jgi:hypothetical protein
VFTGDGSRYARGSQSGVVRPSFDWTTAAAP